MKIASGILLASALLAGVCHADAQKPATEKEKTNYSVGYQIGGDFKRQGIELDADQLVQGIRDAVANAETKIPQSEMTRVLSMLKSRITAADAQRKSARYEADIKEGRAFLEENAKKEGVVSLPNGVQYKVIREGNGPAPGPLDNVSIRYTGRLVGGSEFYSTKNAPQPPNVMVGNFIPGMREVVLLMKEGAHWQAFVPGGEMGYAGGNPLYGKTVIFDIELLEVHKSK